MTVFHVISVSGGKDSDATLQLALDRFPKERVLPIFCDTGNEHEAVYEHLDYLEAHHGIRIDRLKADFAAEILAKRMFIARDQRNKRDKEGRRLRWTNKAKRQALSVMYPSGNPYLDLCMWKGRFPSRKAQFCTQELKTELAVGYQLKLVEAGHRVVSWQGIRRDESMARRNAKGFERLNPRMYAYRPLVNWSAADVFAFLKARGVQPNRLYRQGMSRVGCMPCINANKVEIREIAVRFPGHMDRIEEWEAIVTKCCKRGSTTFMADATDAMGLKDRRQITAALSIRARIEWSKTTRGGQQYDLLAPAAEPMACASAYGLCE